MKSSISIFVALAILTVAFGLRDGRAQQQPISVRLGHVGFPGPDSIFAIMGDEYAKRVNTALKGRVEVKVFHSSQLGSDEQMMRGIKVGAPEMFVPSTIMSRRSRSTGSLRCPTSSSVGLI